MPSDVLHMIVEAARPPSASCNFYAIVMRFVCKRLRTVIPEQVNGDSTQICAAAVSTGSVSLVKWVCSMGYKLKKSDMMGAISCGYTDVLKYAQEQGINAQRDFHVNPRPMVTSPVRGESYTAYQIAARNGHLDVLQWAYENDSIVRLRTDEIASHAAVCGHVDIVKWAYSRGNSAKLWTLVELGKQGNIKLLEWIVNHMHTVE